MSSRRAPAESPRRRAAARGTFADLAALGDVREALAREARERAERVAAEAAAQARVEHERTLFARSVGPVEPIATPASGRRLPPEATRPPPPAPRPRQRERDDRAVLAESIGSGVIDGASLLDTDDALSFRQRGIGPDVVRKLRNGAWAVQAECDLHGLRRDPARERLRGFVQQALQTGLRCVRIVHGKGLGSPGGESVLKEDAKAWLSRRAEVLAWTHARAADGGHGALLVLLRSPRRAGTRPPREPAP